MTPDTWNAISAVASSVAALVAVGALLVAIGAQRDAQEAQRDLQRPTLVLAPGEQPLVKLLLVQNQDTPTLDFAAFDSGNHQDSISLNNAGTGPALNISGVLFGPPEGALELRDRRLTLMPPSIILPGQHGIKVTADNASPDSAFMIVYGTDTVTASGERCTLSSDYSQFGQGVPPIGPYPLARLTLTYHDIYRRKYASIFDLTDKGTWITVAYLMKIEQDLQELSRKALSRRLNDVVKGVLGNLANAVTSEPDDASPPK
jgi:hypothetical protein